MRELVFFACPLMVGGTFLLMNLPQGWAEISAMVCWMGAGLLIGLSAPRRKEDK